MGKKNKNNSVLNPSIRYEGDKVYVVPETARDYFITYYDTPDGMWRSFNSDVNEAVEETNNTYKRIARGDTAYKPLNISPEVTITGYKPIRLKTFYPFHKGYPLTGHSVLKIPITSKVVLEYTGEERPIELVVDKQSNAKDYNLVTNNCADTTLKYLNYIFGTDERTNFFTTPGDVRDFAINKLNGKVITDKHGNDTVIIPRTEENADKLSEKALLLYEKEPDHKTVRWHHLKLGGKVRRMQTASGGSIKVTGKEKENQELKQTEAYIRSYYNSLGFKKRFHNLEKTIIPSYANSKRYNPDTYGPSNRTRLIKLPLKLKKITRDNYIKENARYYTNDHTIALGKYGSDTRLSNVLAHELGHAVSNSIKILNKDGFMDDLAKESPEEFPREPWYDAILGKYPYIYPIFRKSKSYLQFRKKLKSMKLDETRYDWYPEAYYKFEHDGDPDESYADLMVLRSALNRAGILDSRDPNLIADLNTLKKFRFKDKTKYRIFDNFNDDEVIWMLNNVAQNDTLLNNYLNDLTYYAKQGGKLTHIRKMQTAAGGPLYPWTPTVVSPAVQEWASKENTNWRLTPASRSKVFGGATKSINRNKKLESSEEYTKRRIKEETKRTWRSDVADVLHGIGEGALSLHPYTAIPYYGAKVALDFLNGNYGWWTALNASVPLFHLSPQITGVGGATKEFIKDVANTAKSYVSHPTYQTVYHGSPVEFNISEARMGTPYDMGLHVGDKAVADIMRDHRGVVYKLRIPKEQAVTSDLSRNGINHIKTDYKIVNERAGYGELGNWDDYKNIGKTTGVDWNISDDVLMDALKNLGVEGKNYVLDATGYHTKNWPSFRYLRTDENTSIHINPREQLTKNLSEDQRASFNQEADKLLAEFSAAPNTEETAIIYNTKAANLLHKYGINVVKYWNRNPIETLNPSWFVTDPSVIDVVPNMSLSKYRGIWGSYQPEFNLQNASEVYPLGLSATINNNYNIKNKEK